MLQVQKISLTQFKNYQEATFSFTERVIGLCGLNGKGKTNLLDALYYLCFTRSYFSKTDALTATSGTTGFRLDALVQQQAAGEAPELFRAVCVYRGQGKKEFSINNSLYEKFSAHIGRFPCVMIAPDDVELITGGGEDRRKMMDLLLSQLDAVYLQHLITCNKVLQQRNSLLKRFAEQGQQDMALLEILDHQLMQPGNYIHQRRKALAIQLAEWVQRLYAVICDSKETVTLQYESQLNTVDFATLLLQCRQKDFVLQRSNGGIHKDDISFSLNGQVFRNIASQGQRKSLLFAIKLAEFELLKAHCGFAPLLLLDDVFEKLDAERMLHLLRRVCAENSGQVFISDTHRERLSATLAALNVPCQVIDL